MKNRETQKLVMEKYANSIRDWIKSELKDRDLFATGKLYNSVDESLF